MSSLCGPTIAGKRCLQHARRSRRCRRPTAWSASRRRDCRVARLESLGVRDSLDQGDRARRQLAHGADHLRMAGMADQHDLAAAPEMDLGLAMHLGDQRTGGVERRTDCAASPRRAPTCGTPWAEKITGAAVSGISSSSSTKIAPLRPQARRPRSGCARSRGAHRPAGRTSPARARPIDRPHHAGAEAARRAKQHLQRRFLRPNAAIGPQRADFARWRLGRRMTPSSGVHRPRPARCQAAARIAP